jgi:predicted RNase H-like nuclease
MGQTWVAGVDACRGGWIVAFVQPVGDRASARVVPHFADVLAEPEAPAIVAVDMPIGLPERACRGGCAAERAVRPLLGARRSSLFPIPSRQAVFSEPGPFADSRARYAAHQRACAIAQATSDPARRITIFAFAIFPKIREVDAVLRSNRSLTRRVFETHPEFAFCRLNEERPLSEPKKMQGRLHEPGLLLRRRILIQAGLPRKTVDMEPPRGADRDDLLDALACAVVARRIHAGVARAFPDPPERDALGLQMAIWA